MVIAALIVFAALLAAWMLAPAEREASARATHAALGIAPEPDLLAQAA